MVVVMMTVSVMVRIMMMTAMTIILPVYMIALILAI